MKIIKEVLKMEKGGYNRENDLWKRNYIKKMVE